MKLELERDLHVITCILPHGAGFEVLQELHERGIYRADIHSARAFVGSGTGGVFDRVEKDILSVIVSSAEADALFHWIYRQTRMSEIPGAFMYMARLAYSTPFFLPEEIPSETV